MSKKSVIIILIVILVVIISIPIILNNDVNKEQETSKIGLRNVNVSNLKDIKQLPSNYLLNDAQNDGCIIQDENDVYNIERFNTFLDNVNNNKSDYIRIVKYDNNKTTIIMDIQYDEFNSIFLLCYDNTRNEYEIERDRKYEYYIFKELKEYKIDNTKFYQLENLANEIQREQRKYQESISEFSIIILHFLIDT